MSGEYLNLDYPVKYEWGDRVIGRKTTVKQN